MEEQLDEATDVVVSIDAIPTSTGESDEVTGEITTVNEELSDTDDSNLLSFGIIIGCVIGAILLCCICIVLYLSYCSAEIEKDNDSSCIDSEEHRRKHQSAAFSDWNGIENITDSENKVKCSFESDVQI